MTQRIISNRENLLRGRSLTATNIIASDHITRVSSSRQGGGRIELTGPFTGQQDQVIDVEIVNNTINGTPAISQPSFIGVGNQQMNDVTANTGTAAQVITVTLADLGTPTLAAFADLQGVRVVAADPGADGNQITISVEQSGISRQLANFATPDELPEGTRGKVGDEWNFGHEVLLGNGEIPATAPRLAFGSDPQIYRAFKEFRDGQYSYQYSPVIRRGFDTDTPVFKITGSRTVTVTDGTTTETFTDIITRFDFLNALASSTLLDVDGVVASDRLIDGAGAVDLSLQTSAYSQSITPDGTRFVKSVLLDLDIAAGAPTERLTIELKDATTTGAERWEVRGAVSQALGTAVTGLPFLSGDYGFTIPLKLPEGGTPGGTIDIERRLLPRSAQEKLPGLCFEGLLLGAKARSKEFVFTWRPRPAGECDCTTATLSGGPNAECLGLQDVEDIILEGKLSNASLSRLESLSEWRETAIRSNTNIGLPNAGSDNLDIIIIERATNALADALIRADATLDFPAFEASALVNKDDVISAVGHRFIAETSGTTGATEPMWPTVEGQTVTSNQVTFRNIGLVAAAVWDAEFAELQQDLSVMSGILPEDGFLTLPPWVATTSGFPAGEIRPSTANGLFFTFDSCTGTCSTGSTEPTWPTTIGATVLDNEVTWKATSIWWEPSRQFASGELLLPGNGLGFRAANTGTSGTTIPDFNGTGGSSVTDGSITWNVIDTVPGITDPVVAADIVKRYQNAGNNVLLAAGINPFDGASADIGGLCWRDVGAEFYWESEDGLLPIFNGHYYHSARLQADEDGIETIVSTQEFGIGLKVGCEENLKVGDKIVVRLADITNSLRTYQEGDRFDAQIIAASPLQLGGGQDGDDTQVWSVRGSVDGALDNYLLDTTSPAAYSNGGISFLIEPGTLPAAAGDQFTFAIEGGQFRWRADGGTWSADTDIAPTATLADGLVANFITGRAPSFVGGDTTTFSARAVNGASNTTLPNALKLRTDDATTIDLGAGEAQAIALFGYQIANGSTVTLQGSDDGFATSDDFDLTLGRDHAWLQFAAAPITRAAWRLVTDAAVTIPWIWLGVPPKLSAVNGHDDDHAFAATLQPRIERQGNAYLGRGFGGTLGLEYLTATDVDFLFDLLRDVAIDNAGRLAWVPDVDGTKASVVTAELTEIEDQTGFLFQGPVAGVSEHEAQRLQLTLTPVLF